MLFWLWKNWTMKQKIGERGCRGEGGGQWGRTRRYLGAPAGILGAMGPGGVHVARFVAGGVLDRNKKNFARDTSHSICFV